MNAPLLRGVGYGLAFAIPLWFGGFKVARLLLTGWWQTIPALLIGVFAFGAAVTLALLWATAHRDDAGNPYLAPWQDREPGDLGGEQ